MMYVVEEFQVLIISYSVTLSIMTTYPVGMGDFGSVMTTYLSAIEIFK